MSRKKKGDQKEGPAVGALQRAAEMLTVDRLLTGGRLLGDKFVPAASRPSQQRRSPSRFVP